MLEVGYQTKILEVTYGIKRFYGYVKTTKDSG